MIPHEYHTVDYDGYWMTRKNVVLCFVSVDFLLPRIKIVPGGMFLCREATSLSYLPVISVGWQGTTPSLAPEPQASPGHQTAAPH